MTVISLFKRKDKCRSPMNGVRFSPKHNPLVTAVRQNFRKIVLILDRFT